MRCTPVLVIATALLWLPAAGWAQDADGPDWETLADVDTVQVVTRSEDGTRRDTTVWLAVVDEQGYIRTGDTSWGANVVRDPDVAIRVEGAEYRFRVDFVEDDELRERITEVFREKYGFMDTLIGLFRGDRPLIMRLTQP